MAEENKREKGSFMKKYGSFIHISIVSIVVCSIMIYIMVNGG